jgi:diguanylate cyclase (GGDEF)-like protein
VNDSFGHGVGEELLREVTRRLTRCLRTSDTVARLGGDEFVVVLSQVAGPEACAHVAQKIIDVVSKPAVVGGRLLQVGASVGIACHPADGSNASELMRNADAAMYAAKAAGRGTYRFFQAKMHDQASRRLHLEMELRNALRRGELQLFYQPKVWLSDGTPCGVEALLRWHHAELGWVPPVQFVPLAEESGLICELGDWVLQESCRQRAAWAQQGLGGLRVAVNISARQLEHGDFAAHVAALCTQYGVSPAGLDVELTESVIMANPEEIAGVFERLRRLGVQVAADDFGTGYSSLAYLRRLPIDVLKVDRSFVHNAVRDSVDAEIVRTIVALARALRLQVVAEGVETEDQAEFLRSCGCEQAQGYLYARPMPPAQLVEWMHATRAQTVRAG